MRDYGKLTGYNTQPIKFVQRRPKVASVNTVRKQSGREEYNWADVEEHVFDVSSGNWTPSLDSHDGSRKRWALYHLDRDFIARGVTHRHERKGWRLNPYKYTSSELSNTDVPGVDGNKLQNYNNRQVKVS